MRTSTAFACGIACALILGMFWLDPVPYSRACFQPDRTARQVCYRQLSMAMFSAQLQALPNADPRVLRRDKRQLVNEYRQAITSGMLPPTGMSPQDLEHMIDSIINLKTGPII